MSNCLVISLMNSAWALVAKQRPVSESAYDSASLVARVTTSNSTGTSPSCEQRNQKIHIYTGSKPHRYILDIDWWASRCVKR